MSLDACLCEAPPPVPSSRGIMRETSAISKIARARRRMPLGGGTGSVKEPRMFVKEPKMSAQESLMSVKEPVMFRRVNGPAAGFPRGRRRWG